MPPDPFRVLGLPRDATQAEVKRAYRRLAKAFHPDAAGEAAVARFLEIQAAYETLVGGNGAGGRRSRARPAPPPAREPWRADPERAREAREAGRGRTRPGPADETASGERSSRGGRSRNRATPGSTTYDGADQEPFDPDWSGASWYGTTSGTYWTINPREYADPRKHGLEYEARARRHSTRADDGTAERSPDESGTPSPGPAATRRDARRPAAASRPADRRPQFTTVPPAGWVSDPPDPPPSRSLAGFLDDSRRTVSGRIGLAVAGWLPIGIALATALGESTGCSRFAEGCEGPFGLATVVGQGSVVVLLLLLPRLAVIATLGTIAMFAAALPSVAALSIAGGSRDPAGVVPPFVVILAAGWVIGIAIGVGRAVPRFAGGRRPPVP
jgi:curved DNA-binding protein CbpA